MVYRMHTKFTTNVLSNRLLICDFVG